MQDPPARDARPRTKNRMRSQTTTILQSEKIDDEKMLQRVYGHNIDVCRTFPSWKISRQLAVDKTIRFASDFSRQINHVCG